MLTLLANAHVFAPEDLGIKHLLIGADRILAMSDDEASVRAQGAARVDLQGRRVIPGLIDGHAHITGGGGESGFASRVPPVPLTHFSLAGVTSVVGVLGTDDTTRDTRSLVAQAYGLREQGLGAWCHTGGYHVPPTTLTGNVRDDIVFVDPIIGIGELAISDHRSSQPTADELKRIAADAHVAGLITGKAGIVHLHLGDGSRGLEMVRRLLNETEIPARVFNPTHVNRRKALFEEAVDLAQGGSVVDITAFPVEEGEDAWAADVALVRFLDAGAPLENVTVSSDGGGCLPVFDDEGRLESMEIGRPDNLSVTLAALLDSGVSLSEALPAFTSNVARLLRLTDRGQLAVGQRADAVVLGDDAEIDDVMIGGVWHVRDGRVLVDGAFDASEVD